MSQWSILNFSEFHRRKLIFEKNLTGLFPKPSSLINEQKISENCLTNENPSLWKKVL